MSFAGLIACDVNVRDGRDSAAAQTLDEEDEGGLREGRVSWGEVCRCFLRGWLGGHVLSTVTWIVELCLESRLL